MLVTRRSEKIKNCLWYHEIRSDSGSQSLLACERRVISSLCTWRFNLVPRTSLFPAPGSERERERERAREREPGLIGLVTSASATKLFPLG